MAKILSAIAILFLTAPLASGQGEFWGELRAGRYGAGFRAVYQADAARAYDPDYPSGGVPAGKKARPLLAAIWYPAPPGEGKSMLHRDYLRVLTLDGGATEFAPRLRTHTRDQAALYMLGREFDDLTDDERGKFDGLLATPVFAVLNAPPAEGRFPVVLYHPGLGGTFEDNAVLCEFLASHGYVVISSAYQPADSSSLNIDGDLETSFADLAMLLRYAATLPFVDAERVAAIGHSYGAQAVMGWRALPNSPLDAVVFLDSAVLYTGLDAPNFAAVKAAVARNPKSTAPVLLVADRERHPHFETFAPYLKYAPHYEADTPALEHNAFVSQGAVVKDEAARRAYEAVCAVILQFLNTHVKGLPGTVTSEVVHVRFTPGAPAPPTGAQIARLFRVDAPESRQALAAFLKLADVEALLSAAEILFEDDEKKPAVELLKQAVHLHPKSAAIQEALGSSLLQTGDADGAQAAFDKALKLLPGDDTLTAGQKAQLQASIEQSRKK